jgi:hypothetical protein
MYPECIPRRSLGGLLKIRWANWIINFMKASKSSTEKSPGFTLDLTLTYFTKYWISSREENYWS